MRAAACKRLLFVLVLLFCPGSLGRVHALEPGDVLGRDNWQEAEGLLPPEILAHYRNGEYVSLIVDWPDGVMEWEAGFKTAARANGERFTVSEQGTIIDKTTGEQPPLT